MRRRRAGLAAIALLAGLAPVVTVGSPAAADPACTTEDAPRDPILQLPTGQHCDDTMPPVTAGLAATPAVNDAGFVNATAVAFAFTGTQPTTDATDDDPTTFQCRLFVGPTAPASLAWSTCTSGQTWKSISGESWDSLRQTRTVGQPYTFEVRAVDSVDDGTDITSPLVNLLFPADEDKPDYDETPERVTFSVDSERPQESRIVGKPTDPLNANWPMLKQPRLSLTLEVTQDKGSPVTAGCDLDEAPVPCQPGPFTLTGLTPGDHVFSLRATDAAGNKERSADEVLFTVPTDLAARGKAWKTVSAAGSFAGDYLQTTRVGAELRVPAAEVREVRLIAPSGPGQGKIEVYVGSRLLRTISLAAGEANPFRVFTVRPPSSTKISRPITIRAVRVPKGGAVRVDAVLLR